MLVFVLMHSLRVFCRIDWTQIDDDSTQIRSDRNSLVLTAESGDQMRFQRSNFGNFHFRRKNRVTNQRLHDSLQCMRGFRAGSDRREKRSLMRETLRRRHNARLRRRGPERRRRMVIVGGLVRRHLENTGCLAAFVSCRVQFRDHQPSQHRLLEGRDRVEVHQRAAQRRREVLGGAAWVRRDDDGALRVLRQAPEGGVEAALVVEDHVAALDEDDGVEALARRLQVAVLQQAVVLVVIVIITVAVAVIITVAVAIAVAAVRGR